MHPAWSEQFLPDRLRPIPSLELPAPITREWAWGNARGYGVRVAVVDSGVDGSHPRIGGIAGGVVVEHGGRAQDPIQFVPGPHEDLFGHGTACAGIIKTIAPECEIYSVRVLGPRLSGKGLVFAAGLRWAIEHGMRVVNLSLSTGRRDFFGVFHELADEAYFRNVMLICAANNIGGESYPAQYASVLSVAAMQATPATTFAYNPSPPVEFGAPGLNVDVAWLNHATVTATGNSFAAPVIAGLVTRILSKHPSLTPFQVKTILHQTADNAETQDSLREGL